MLNENNEKLIKLINEAHEKWDQYVDDFKNNITKVPKTRDEVIAEYLIQNNITEVKHGEWIECENELNKYCSNCKKVHGDIYYKPPFCENCGAIMDGGKNNV